MIEIGRKHPARGRSARGTIILGGSFCAGVRVDALKLNECR